MVRDKLSTSQQPLSSRPLLLLSTRKCPQCCTARGQRPQGWALGLEAAQDQQLQHRICSQLLALASVPQTGRGAPEYQEGPNPKHCWTSMEKQREEQGSCDLCKRMKQLASHCSDITADGKSLNPEYFQTQRPKLSVLVYPSANSSSANGIFSTVTHLLLLWKTKLFFSNLGADASNERGESNALVWSAFDR